MDEMGLLILITTCALLSLGLLLNTFGCVCLLMQQDRGGNNQKVCFRFQGCHREIAHP